MGRVRKIALAALPQGLISWVTGRVTRIPLPRGLRKSIFTRFARRYGASLDEVAGELTEYRSLAEFFARPLRDGARPLADSPLVSPCDGRIVSSGPLIGTRLAQIKGHEYEVAELLRDPVAAERYKGGSQATIYLAPGDYHRVHSPFDGELRGTRHIRGRAFPVNPPAVDSIDGLFCRNERVVFDFDCGGQAAAVIMVAALNVADIHESVSAPATCRRGDEIGRFGFGSTTIVVLGPGPLSIAEQERETRILAMAELMQAQSS